MRDITWQELNRQLIKLCEGWCGVSHLAIMHRDNKEEQKFYRRLAMDLHEAIGKVEKQMDSK